MGLKQTTQRIGIKGSMYNYAEKLECISTSVEAY